MDLNDLDPQDRQIIVEALLYWAYDLADKVKIFDRSDPRRNRAVELAEE